MNAGGAEAPAEADSRQTVVAALVAVALVVRLLTLAVAMVGLVGSTLTVQALVAVLLLAGTSFVGLLGGRILEVVVRHPGLALLDVLLVLGVQIILGVGSPLTLATFSTAFLIGVLFPVHLACLLGFCLACGYLIVVQTARGGAAVEGESFFLVVGVPVTYACLIGIGQSFRRIAARQAAVERELREVSRSAATADERARLAREMHDSIAKTLQGIVLGASALPEWVRRNPEEAERQARALAAAGERAVQEARELLVALRRDRVEEPFEDVLSLTCREWSDRFGIPCELAVTLSRDPAPAVRYDLLTALCEALDNVSHHADAGHVRVSVRDDGVHSIVTEVFDDGRGFDVQAASRREHDGHFGLRGMRERMEALGGTAVVRSKPGRGTTVILRCPSGREAGHGRAAS